jgi:hypothetical protein
MSVTGRLPFTIHLLLQVEDLREDEHAVGHRRRLAGHFEDELL